MNIQILSEGLPPERHADRIIWEMMRLLATDRAKHWPTVVALIRNSSDGNPKAQHRLQQRLARAGIRSKLDPGKRGKYMLWFYTVIGWDLQKDCPILAVEAVPEQPQIACTLTILEGGNGRTRVYADPVLFITHHVLSRMAQRFHLRTAEHMIRSVDGMLACAMRLLMDDKGGDWKRWLNEAPADGYRVRLPDGKATLILKPHESHHALVAATIF